MALSPPEECGRGALYNREMQESEGSDEQDALAWAMALYERWEEDALRERLEAKGGWGGGRHRD